MGNIKAISGFNQISEEKFLAYVELIKPAGKEVAEKLYGDFSEDANLAIHEERVFDFVKKYVTSLRKEKTELFLKYVTGYEIMARDLKIAILLNGISENEQMLPKANTFSSSIIISRFFFQYDLVEKSFENLLSNENV